MFIAVTITICNKQQQNYRSTCKLHLNYKLYNTLNIKTKKHSKTTDHHHSDSGPELQIVSGYLTKFNRDIPVDKSDKIPTHIR